MVKRKVILFANTLWFLNRFKYSLILDLLQRDYEVVVVYFRKGPIKDLEKLNLNRHSIKIHNFFSFLFQEYLNIRSVNKTNKILLSYTVGPILISSLPIFRSYKRV